MNTPPTYYCDVCGERYSTKNAADRCKQLPREELKFSVGSQVIVDEGKRTQRAGTIVSTKLIGSFNSDRHWVSYTVELPDKSLVQRSIRLLQEDTSVAHSNKQEILDGIAAGREWEFRPIGHTSWTSPEIFQKFPTWVTGYEYRLKPVANPHPNRAEVEAGIAAGRTWECKHKALPDWVSGESSTPNWNRHYEYRLTPEPEYVPLAPEDVPPGSVLRWGFGQPGWSNFDYVSSTGVWLPVSSESEFWSFERLREKCEINRSLPLTGKWDANAWEPCKKLKQ